MIGCCLLYRHTIYMIYDFVIASSCCQCSPLCPFYSKLYQIAFCTKHQKLAISSATAILDLVYRSQSFHSVLLNTNVVDLNTLYFNRLPHMLSTTTLYFVTTLLSHPGSGHKYMKTERSLTVDTTHFLYIMELYDYIKMFCVFYKYSE